MLSHDNRQRKLRHDTVCRFGLPQERTILRWIVICHVEFVHNTLIHTVEYVTLCDIDPGKTPPPRRYLGPDRRGMLRKPGQNSDFGRNPEISKIVLPLIVRHTFCKNLKSLQTWTAKGVLDRPRAYSAHLRAYIAYTLYIRGYSLYIA